MGAGAKASRNLKVSTDNQDDASLFHILFFKSINVPKFRNRGATKYIILTNRRSVEESPAKRKRDHAVFGTVWGTVKPALGQGKNQQYQHSIAKVGF
jgi:hypothetical protein